MAGPAANVDNALFLIGEQPSVGGAILDIRLGDTNVSSVADKLIRLGIPFVFATALEPDQIPSRHTDKIVLRKPVENDAIATT